jgi:twitching motility protein PilT
VTIERIIKAAVDRGASDIHIKAGDSVRVRIDGRLVVLTKQALTGEQTRAIALHLLEGEADRQRIDVLRDHDCSWAQAGVGRFRVNIMRQRGAHSIVMRVISESVPTVEMLRLPPVIERIAHAERGMVLVTGVTGSGKSSTMAAMVHTINAHQAKHIVTLENPIEFLHRDHKASISQREVGIDTDSFRMGLRAALRQDPDVILIGEMRDPETIDTAMKAAETGHLLVSTLHTPDAQSTIMRVVAMFPLEQQTVVRMRLAESLHAVVSQRLLPRADGKGRVVACEVMIVTPTIRDLIVENRVSEIRDYIADGRVQYGMQTFDQHLTELVHSGELDFETALGAATRPADFELNVRTLRRGERAPARPEHAGSAQAAEAGIARAEERVPMRQGTALAADAVTSPTVLGGGPMPPLAAVPTARQAVTSPSPLGERGDSSVFGSGFESLFGG